MKKKKKACVERKPPSSLWDNLMVGENMLARTQKGFTLIELVMVIVILGILAAVVIPQFVNLSGEANRGAAQGVAGNMSSAMAVNYSTRLLTSVAGTSAIGDCTDISKILQGGIPVNYTVQPQAITSGTLTCQVSNGSYTAPFVGIFSN
jgi:MSHA pilin protein MshA